MPGTVTVQKRPPDEPGRSICCNCGSNIELAAQPDRVQRCPSCQYITITPFAAPLRDLNPENSPFADVAPNGLLRDRYRLVCPLGKGAHGVTLFAMHEFLDHPCVAKLLPHRVSAASDGAVRRLREEARAGFRVSDPHVARIIDCDCVGDVWYFVMEFVDGADLAVLAEAEARLCWEQAAKIMRDAATGLAAIHRAGLIHRDVKPGNLILGCDGRTRVADLGVAALSEEIAGASTAGLTGTLGYTAPEVLAPDVAVDARADLYSLAATIFHSLTGAPPHARPSVFESLIDAQTRALEWPEDRAPGVPPWLVAVVLRALHPDPERRHASAEELIDHLSKETAVVASPPGRRPAEVLQPRGIVIPPLENRGEASDAWLGVTVADFLARALGATPEVYVADAEQFGQVLQREGIRDVVPRARRLLEAGRLLGAATVVEGHFARDGDSLELVLEILRAGSDDPAVVARERGPLSNLVAMQGGLLQALAGSLEITAAAEPRQAELAREVPLSAREKFVLAKQQYLSGDYDAAIESARAALAIDAEFVEPLGFVGVCCARLGRYEEAEEHYRHCVEAAAAQDDARLLVETQANQAVMHYFKGDYDAAHRLYRQAATAAEPLGLTSELAQIHNNLGFVLVRLGRPQEAQEAFDRAITTHRQYGALVSLVGPYNGLGNVLLDEQRYDEARSYYRRALALAQEVADRVNVGVTRMHLGRCAALQGRFGDAKSEFAMALNAMEETSFWNGLARLYEYMADMNGQLGNWIEVARCADKRVGLARRHANWRMEAAAWNQKAEALERVGRGDEAAACRTHAAGAEAGGER